MAFTYSAGAEFLVNTVTSGAQNAPKVTYLSNGGFVVTWQDASAASGGEAEYNIKAQLFDAAGAKVGSEFLVNTRTDGVQEEPDVGSLPSGGFVIAWRDYEGDNSVSVQVYDSFGVPKGGQRTVTVENLGQEPSVAGVEQVGITHQDGAYSFVVTWKGVVGPGDPDSGPDIGIAARIYNFFGNPSPAFQVGTSAQAGATAAGLSNSTFVVAWQDRYDGAGTTAERSGIRAQIYELDGNRIGAEIRVNTETLGIQSDPAITVLSNGNFAVTWLDRSQTLGDSSSSSIKGQIFTAAGVKVGSEFLINTETANAQARPAVAGLKDGGLVVVWDDTSLQGGDASTSSIKAQLFDAAGVKVGTEMLVNTATNAGQWQPDITVLADGSFVITWEDNSGQGGDSNGTAVKAKLFQATYTPAPGEDSQTGTPGNDTLIGTPANDTIDGGAGNDSIVGLGGDDSLTSGAGYDTLDGGDGNDVIIMSPNSGGRAFGGAGNDTVYGSNLHTYVYGDEGDDLLYAGSGGGAGNQLNGGPGYDTLHGGEANNGLTGGTEADLIYGYGGNDNIDGGDGNDTLDGGDGDDNIRAGKGNDSILGGAGNDEIFSDDYLSAGNDFIDGGLGNDTMYGELGNDTYVVRDAGDRVIEVETGGFDVVLAYADFQAGAFIENITGQGTANIVLSGNALNNVITGNSGRNTIKGNDGNDTIDGAEGNDKIDGGNGDDRLWGGADSDQLTGGEGSDSLEGGAGGDQLNGGARWDTLRGGEGNDILDGGADNDAMYGGTGNDTFVVNHIGDRVYELYGEGTDTVKASINYSLTADVEVLYLIEGAISGTGNGLSNALNGSSLNNILSGGLGNDSLYGWDGDDSLVGGNDHDRLSGGNGNDTMTGGHGNDVIGGGTGADDFVFSSTAVNGHDHIVDFEHGLDALVFTGGDYGFASGHVLTDAEFTVGAVAVGSSAQFVWDSVGRHLYFDADGDGAGAAIELAMISGGAVVTKDDLVLI